MVMRAYARYVALLLVLIAPVWGAEYHGQVRFGELPLPGATVSATQGDKKLSAVSDENGIYSFPDLPEGSWQLQVDMVGFTPTKQEVTPNGLPGPNFELKMLPLDQIQADAAPAPQPSTVTSAAPAGAAAPAGTPASGAGQATPSLVAAQAAVEAANKKPAKGKGAPAATGAASSFQRTNLSGNAAAGPAEPAPEVTSELSQRAADAGVINGSTVNGASTPFAQSQAFGNARRNGRSLYNGNISIPNYSNSVLNARSYSLTGQDTPKPSTSYMNTSVTYGGPVRIPHLIDRNGPQFTVSYQRVRSSSANISSTLMPDQLERGGNFSQALNSQGGPAQIFDPTTGLPFQNNIIPVSRISQQALALLPLFPTPNFTGSNRQNYQVPTINDNHTDSFQARMNKNFKRKNTISGSWSAQDSRSSNDNTFNFLDRNRSFGQNATVSFSRSFTTRFRGTVSFNFNRSSNQTYPFFSNRQNISGLAGIGGNDQDPLNWGPPSLSFTSIAGLSDQNASVNHSQSNTTTYSGTWGHGRHGITFGGDLTFLQTNLISQSNPRGTFVFNGASTQQYDSSGNAIPGTGLDFAGFLLGIPDASRIAFGNADKYYRSKRADLNISDDWRVAPGLTLNIGARWDFSSPVSEKYNRLVNLDVAPGFTSATPVVASKSLKGALTGQTYPDTLVKANWREFQPGIGFSWRPLPASSMVVRGGYSLRYQPSAYQPFVGQMATQSPLSTALNITNSPSAPLTLAHGFYAPPNQLTNTFALDPNLKVAYSQVWNIGVQRDLPFSLVMNATYTGTKGTHLLQAFVPNTYPTGAANPCPSCQSGYTYYTSGGNLEAQQGVLQLRRRLHNGFTADLKYTYGKILTDAASLGGGLGNPAQNWLNLEGERGRAPGDQRHNVQLNMQYTSGMGIGGGTLMSGWRGRVLKDWTFGDSITFGSGLPITPTYAGLISGGVQGTIRASYIGKSVYDAPEGFYLNPLAVTAPFAGQWGNAGVGSLSGPAQFSMNGTMQRSFKLSDRFNLAATISANNVLNHVVVTSLYTTVSPQFGLPSAVNQMRSIQTSLRLTF